MFHVIEKEIRWRKDHGRPEGFDALKTSKPIIAVGADEPLGGERLKAAYYRTSASTSHISDISTHLTPTMQTVQTDSAMFTPA